ncbi:hypothetical protein FKM82_003013 [Ascaphus truei]
MSWSLCKIPVHRIIQSSTVGCTVRTIHLKDHLDRKEESENSKPLTFSSSKGSHRQWTVEQSFGSDYQRPLWKVLPLSLLLGSILIWAAFREETHLDEAIFKPIEQLQEIKEDGTEETKKNGS